jgi:hypothetical protein
MSTITSEPIDELTKNRTIPTLDITYMTAPLTCNYIITIQYVCMYKGWAMKLAHAPRPLMIYCASLLTTAIIITVAALRIVLAHGSKPT